MLILILLFGGAFVVYLGGRLARASGGEEAGRGFAGMTAAFFILASLAAAWPVLTAVLAGQAPTVAAGLGPLPLTLRADGLSGFMLLAILGLGLLVTIFSIDYMNHDRGAEKYFALLLLMIGGMVGQVLSTDLFNIWVFFEVMTVASYVLVAFRKDHWEPIEAGFKYIVASSIGSAVALLGIAVVYMYTGTLQFDGLRSAILNMPAGPFLLALALFVAGFGVKAAIVPFHTWLPDAHSAAPSGISAMLSGIVIQTGLFAMIRIVTGVFGAYNTGFGLALALFAVLTMTVGNLAALPQKDIKRMLAYSSVAQMGYIILGLGVGFYYGLASGVQGGLFHIVNHAFMKGLAFLAAGIVIHQIGTRDIDSMRGLGRRAPVTALCFTVAALGLAGIPPLSGFMSKFLIFKSGVEAGGFMGYFFALAGILNSVVSLGYYLPVIGRFYARDAGPEMARTKEAPPLTLLPMVVLALITIYLGVFPGAGLRLVQPAVDLLARLVGGM
jgi:proton-translocating NADH-quinone oxidoreductase chain N